MRKYKLRTIEIQLQVVFLRGKGMTLKKISEITEMATSTASDIVKLFRNRERPGSAKKSEHPKLLQGREEGE